MRTGTFWLAINRDAEPTQPLACKIAGQKRRHRDIALGMEQFDVEAELLEIAPLDRQIEMKKVKTLARIADENFLPRRRETAHSRVSANSNRTRSTCQSSSVVFPPNPGVME